MTLYMLDTNTASYVIKGKPESIRNYLKKIPIESICISSITKAELLYGVAKKPEAKTLAITVDKFLSRVDVLPWNSHVAEIYARFRQKIESKGFSLSPLDMLIAAHAFTVNAVLVTNDQVFYHLENILSLEDWTSV